jgi:hypothetical protein
MYCLHLSTTEVSNTKNFKDGLKLILEHLINMPKSSIDEHVWSYLLISVHENTSNKQQKRDEATFFLFRHAFLFVLNKDE